MLNLPILLTDSCSRTVLICIFILVNGTQEEFNLPMNSPIPGSEMTREPFRWDQRLFALVLRLTGKFFTLYINYLRLCFITLYFKVLLPLKETLV